MTKRERLLTALLAERFDAKAIEAEAVEVAEPETLRLGRALRERLEPTEPAVVRERRRTELLSWPEPSHEQIAAVPMRFRGSARVPRRMVGKPRARLDALTLVEVRAADAMRKRIARRSA